MPKASYNWKRFWCERGGTFSLSDNGYLTDPDSEYGPIYNPGLVSTGALEADYCAILLGEPGIGKSHCISKMWETLSIVEREHSLWFDLRAYGSEERVINDIFANASVRSWINGNEHLRIYLDSLDECLLRVETLAAILSDELCKLPTERLKLRIACRTANWPTTLEARLTEAWGEEGVKIHELTPLRKLDVTESVKTKNIDHWKFFEEVDQLHLVPLAIKPITLNFLLNIYLRSGRFPSNQIELYGDGCRILCEEPSRPRREAGFIGLLSADQRLAVAKRIAAVTVFANRYAIWTSLDLGAVPNEDIAIRDLIGDVESANGNAFTVTEQAVKETLGTGLFSSRGSDRMGWAHQTYAEFLAACFLLEHCLSIEQINGLIMHSGDTVARVVPQLGQIGAWLGRMVPVVFKRVLKSDSDLLLLSDVAFGSPADRENLTCALLELSEEEKLLPYNTRIHAHLHKLNNPNLTDLLRPYICDIGKGRFARHLAIDIAEACQVNGLSDELATLALAKDQPLDIRISAAYAVSRVGIASSKKRLLPLAIGVLDDDPQDELKGCALRATWPDFLSTQDLFSNLTPSKDNSLFGAYWTFLERELPGQLRLQDLNLATDWIENQAHLRDAFSALHVGIVLLMWDNLEAKGVADRLAKLILTRLRLHYDLFPPQLSRSDPKLSRFSQELASNLQKRQILLSAFIPHLRELKEGPFLLTFRQPTLVGPEDLSWLLTTLSSSADQDTKRVLAEIISKITTWKDRNQFDAVLNACRVEPILASVLSWLVDPVLLNSPAAERMKASFLEEKEFERQRLERPLVDPPPTIRIERHLEKIEAGDLEPWVSLCLDLTLTPISTYYEEQFSPRLTSLPGWESSDASTRSRILFAARQYVTLHNPNKADWIGKNVFHWRDFSGYKALQLLFEESPDYLRNLSSAFWKKWTPVILAYPLFTESAEKVLTEILKLAYPHAIEEFQATLSQLIEHEITTNKNVFISKRVMECWDASIAQTLLRIAKLEGLNATSLGDLLDVLLSKQTKDAQSLARSLVSVNELISPGKRERTIAVSVVLIRREHDAGWPLIWPLLKQDANYGRAVFEAVSFAPNDNSNFLERIDEEGLGELYCWLVSQYEINETASKTPSFMGPSHTVTMLQQGVLSNLTARGTAKSVWVLDNLSKTFPDSKWLRFFVLEAQNNTRQKTWVPLRPIDILSLSRDSKSRVVQSGAHLLNVIIESLERLQDKLQAEVPYAQFLWFPSGNKTFRPRAEEEISDFVKIHLDQDLEGRGIVVNREVRIHRGQRTDIHVNAVIDGGAYGPLDIISVIIEVKGAWNPELSYAMEKQLVGEYLKDNHCQCGLYLVGWFESTLWDDGDVRKTRHPKCTLENAREKFEAQASELTKESVVVRSVVVDAGLRPTQWRG